MREETKKLSSWYTRKGRTKKKVYGRRGEERNEGERKSNI